MFLYRYVFCISYLDIMFTVKGKDKNVPDAGLGNARNTTESDCERNRSRRGERRSVQY
jgi:hypothetical protein